MTNYEAFYLDYLEGNLSGEALAAFEAFLLAHPDLAVDEEPLLSIPSTEDVLDPVSKLALKQGIDMNDLQPSTLSFFLIAREEGLLSADQEAQLNHWLEANAHYRQDAQLMALVKLEPSAADVYTNKPGLKRREARIVPMWFTGVAVAAGVALIITLSLNQTGGTSPEGGTAVAEHSDSTHTNKPVKGTPSRQQDSNMPANGQQGTTAPTGSGTYTPQPVPDNGPQQDQYAQQAPSNRMQHPGKEDGVTTDQLARLPQHKLDLRTPSKHVQPLDIAPYEPTASEMASTATTATAGQNDLAWTSVDEMKNPITPLTNKLSSTLNTAVDFRTAKATKKKSGGFFLKIGKLEISHQSASL